MRGSVQPSRPLFWAALLCGGVGLTPCPAYFTVTATPRGLLALAGEQQVILRCGRSAGHKGRCVPQVPEGVTITGPKGKWQLNL